MHKIATSGYYKSSLIEIEREWSIDDGDEALAVIGYMEEAERRVLKRIAK